MKIPTIKEARAILDEASKLNPGPWVEHSIYTAEAAGRIAENHKELVPDVAYTLGLLHDIGRRYGVTNMKHTIDGYNYLMEKGYSDAAKICLTHSFPYKDMNVYFGKKDCTEMEVVFIRNYLEHTAFNDYDRLIQLCDALALPEGFCLMEKRMVDVALRHGTNEHTVLKWKSTFAIKERIEKAIGKSIYSILPGVVENTFEFTL